MVYKIPFDILYRYYSTNKIPDGDFIYFPLHVSPEFSTYPCGWNFEDQCYAIEYLSQILPEGINIIVKEHPNQLAWVGRGLFFYSSLKKLKNVRLISKEANQFLLIDKSAAVASIAGQVCWEALTNGKPAIYFGQAWYTGAPGSIKINEFREMDMDQRKKFLAGKKEIDLQHWYTNFHKRTFPGFLSNVLFTGDKQDPNLLAKSLNTYLANEIAHGLE